MVLCLLVMGTLKVTVIAAIVAVPIGLASAIYLSEYASDKTRRIIKPILEVLAGIPTIVYGFFALTFVTPLLRAIYSFLRNVQCIKSRDCCRYHDYTDDCFIIRRCAVICT